MIQQPTVRHHVHGGIGRIHVHGAKRAIPISPDAFERGAAGIRPAKAPDKNLHIRRAATNAEAKTGFAFFAIRQIKRHLHRAARIQARADFTGKTLTLQGRRLRQVSVAADEFFPVAGERARGVIHVEEHDTVGKFGVEIIARQ